MPDGTTVHPKLTLTLEEGQLTGATSYRPGSEAPITNAVLSGRQLRFQVIREREGRSIVTTYSGSWVKTNLIGQIQSNWAGENQTYPWVAYRAHVGVEGVWVWRNAFGPRGGRNPGRTGRGGSALASKIALEQDGEKITGRVLGRFGRMARITDGSITNNEVSFEIRRDFRDLKTVAKYRGKQTGDTIAGTMEFEFGGRVRKANWEAKRVD